MTNLEKENDLSTFTQLNFDSSEEDWEILTFSITDPEHLSTVNDETIWKIKEGDSLKKAINIFGIPNNMRKNKEGIIKATWLWETQLFGVELTLENNRITNIMI
ncbi:hypothetical protein IGJ34_000819 [Enterococcus sp. AZ177]